MFRLKFYLADSILPPESVSHIPGPETVYDLIRWEGATGTSREAFGDLLQAQGSEFSVEFTSQ